MVLKKQTIWLLTMLSLMVVLSAYYLFNPPIIDEQMSGDTGTSMSGEKSEEDADSDLLDLESMAWLEEIGEGDVNSDVTFSVETDNSLDFFLSYRMDRETQRGERLEHYENLISSNDATAMTAGEAKQEYDALQNLAWKEQTVETMIKSKGYEEAVVIAGDEKVNVVVRSDNALSRNEVVEIIHLVREEIDVVGNQIFVSYK